MKRDRAVETDRAVREADLSGVLAFYLLRHAALLNATEGSEEQTVYRLARDSAEREVLWRFAELQEHLEQVRAERHAAQAMVGGIVGALMDHGYRFPENPTP